MTRRTSLSFGWLAAGVASLAAGIGCIGCGPGRSQVSFMSNERPSGYTGSSTPGVTAPASGHQNPNGGSALDLGDDDFVEPARPAADTKQERALVHIHGPKDVVCSGVVVGDRLVATAQRCLRGQPKGVTALGPGSDYRVEIASSTLTWTNRRAKFAVLPQCEENELDVAILVLDESIPPLVIPLKVVSAPSTGARVQALGFGHCKGSNPLKDRIGTVRSRVSQAIIIDVPLCKGDVGGPVIDGPAGELIGVISHRDDPEGSPLKTATIARVDTVWALDLIAQAKVLADGADVGKVKPVACH